MYNIEEEVEDKVLPSPEVVMEKFFNHFSYDEICVIKEELTKRVQQGITENTTPEEFLKAVGELKAISLMNNLFNTHLNLK